MSDLSVWELLLLGAMVLLLLFWFGPGVRVMLEKSREAEKDWPALLLPIAAVILFVLLLVMLV